MESTAVEFWNTIGTWVSGLGTIGAVITSLWLASNSNKVKLKINASSSILLDTVSREKQKVCQIGIVNIGIRPVKINTIGWEIKRGKHKQSFIQNTNGSFADKVPLTLNEGDDATIIIDFEGKGKWLKSMAKNMEGYNIKDLKLIVVTNIESFKCNIDDNLVKEIKEERKRLLEVTNN